MQAHGRTRTRDENPSDGPRATRAVATNVTSREDPRDIPIAGGEHSTALAGGMTACGLRVDDRRGGADIALGEAAKDVARPNDVARSTSSMRPAPKKLRR